MPRRLGNWIDSFMQYTNDSEAPATFRIWTAHSVIAACLQRKCVLNVGHLTYYPNLYIVLIGPSGSRKGTAMKPGLAILREVPGVKLAAEAITREALIRQLRMSNYSQIDPETGKIYLHSSLTIFSPEMAVFLGYNNQVLISDLSDWYDCRDPWVYRTKSQGVDEIRGVWVNLIGATTPELLLSTLPRDAVGGGLTSRIVFVYETTKEKDKSPFDQSEDSALWLDLIHDLEIISQMRGEYTYTEEYSGKWNEWYYKQSLDPPFKDRRLGGYLSRRSDHLTKVSMIYSAARSDSMELNGDDFDRALSVIVEVERKMAKTFSGFGKFDLADVLSRVATTIAMETSILFSHLLTLHHYDVDKDGLRDIVSTLHTMNYCSLIKQENDILILYNEDEDAPVI